MTVKQGAPPLSLLRAQLCIPVVRDIWQHHASPCLRIVLSLILRQCHVVCRHKKDAAVAAHQQFSSKLGDHITSLNLYRAYISVPSKQQHTWCSEHFVSARSLQKATRILQQLHQHLVELKLPIASCGSEVEPVLKALVAGLFTNAARLQPDGEHQSPHTITLFIVSSLHSCSMLLT